MIQLKPDESRVLGVLVEKAQTTPQQYPLTLNALVSGCNQKNNRFPVVDWDEERVYDAVDALRTKRLINEVNLTGSRVPKFKHNAREVLGVDTNQLVMLTELLLRGPQSIGDLRGNASRMHPIESLEVARNILDSLMSPARPEPLIKEVPPPPGGRARLFVQLLCPDLHPIAQAASTADHDHARADQPRAASTAASDARLEAMDQEIARLKSAISSLARQLGAPDPLA